MILITGGAGFIGSNLAISLQEKGHDNIVICDHFGSDDKWQNLRKHGFNDIVFPEHLFEYMDKRKDDIDVIFHMGAISSTTESDADKLLKNNFVFSSRLWDWCAENNTRMIYASSCATYGAGEKGFKDEESVEYLNELKPLSPYAWSKHLFDLRCAKRIAEGKPIPPQWVGAKIFSVYGPNEYHKDVAQSILAQRFPRAERNLKVPLYRSQHPEIGDGEQVRDFMYVMDCCKALIWFMEKKGINGIYNVGTGEGHTYRFLTECLFKAVGNENVQITYEDMPQQTAERYQYFAKADIDKLRKAGYEETFTPLDEGVLHYIKNYLEHEDSYR